MAENMLTLGLGVHYIPEEAGGAEDLALAERGAVVVSVTTADLADLRVFLFEDDRVVFHPRRAHGTTPGTWHYASECLAFPQAVVDAGGVATILDATTSVVVTHGLSAAPAAKNISVVGTNSPANTPGHIWVDTITATEFTIHCTVDPGVGGATFAWAVRSI